MNIWTGKWTFGQGQVHKVNVHMDMEIYFYSILLGKGCFINCHWMGAGSNLI